MYVSAYFSADMCWLRNCKPEGEEEAERGAEFVVSETTCRYAAYGAGTEVSA